MTISSIRTSILSFILGTAIVFAGNTLVRNADAEDEIQQVTQAAYGITTDYGKWPLGILPFVYNPTGAPAGYTDAIVEQIFADAIREWEAYCNVNFVYGGVNSGIDIDNINDNTPVFGWGDLGGAAGVAGPAFGGISATWGHVLYVDGSLKLSNTVYTGLGSTPGEIVDNAISIRSTTIHELGHFLGLGHSDRPDSIMYSNPYNSVSHTLQDDIDACRTMYGYSGIYNPPSAYEPPAAGTNTYGQLFLSESVNFPDPAPATDDGLTFADSDGLLMAYFQPTDGYADDLVTVVVDPHGRATRASNAAVVENDVNIFGDGLVSFQTVRETPGVWTFYAYDSTGLLYTETLNVTTSLPVVNDAPTANFTYTENPATRAFSGTIDVTGDTEGDLATAIWSRPTIGQTTVNFGASTGNDSRNVTLPDDNFDWEIFVDVRDDAVRYDGSGTPPAGPAGQGFHNLQRYYASPISIGPDLGGDNYGDIVWRNTATGENWVYGLAGSLKKSSDQLPWVSNTNWEIVGTGDYNADGKTDILWWNSVTGQLHLWTMDGGTRTSSDAVVTIGGDWRVVGNGDYDRDGSSDILLRNAVTGQVWMFLMNGSTVSTSTFVENVPDLNWQIVGSGDYDDDGRADILWRNTVTGQVWIFLMNGATISTSAFVDNVADLNWTIVGSGDFDGNGNCDILWRNTSTGDVWIYFMNGATISSDSYVSTVTDQNWKVSGNGDYNGDSLSDIMWRYDGAGAVAGTNAFYLMSGATILGTASINTVADLNWKIVNRN